MILSSLSVRWRRIGFALAASATYLALMGLMAYTLSPGGFDVIDWLLLIAIAIPLPRPIIELWNAIIGLSLMIFSRQPEIDAAPASALGLNQEPITTRTAILVCVRNEDPARLRRNLDIMFGGLAASGAGDKLQGFILSDSFQLESASAEEQLAADLKRRFAGQFDITYRRRAVNTGFKAGNIRDFCDRWGRDFDHMVVLDADSFMSTAAILRLIRVMQADSKLGIVQSLVVGLPSTSPFARVFQFGMRLGMRSFTLGSAYWQADCGPYWGHNAIIRLKPFIEQCELPLVGGKHILSHDQVEATLMRRAGYEVRVLLMDDGSWEENPPTLIEFIRRDLRWCEGNMQYFHLLGLPGLHGMGRFQLSFAIVMFNASPAWVLFTVLAALRLTFSDPALPAFRADSAALLVGFILLMTYSSRVTTVFEVLASRRMRRSFGGFGLFTVNFILETIFTTILIPTMVVTHTFFMAGLCIGRTIGWTSQLRDEHRLSFASAISRLWLQTLIGVIGFVWFASISTTALLYAMPIVGSLILAVPFAMLSSWPELGTAFARMGIARIPEENNPSDALKDLHIPAIEAAMPARPVTVGVAQ